jgi:hypothetical protein
LRQGQFEGPCSRLGQRGEQSEAPPPGRLHFGAHIAEDKALDCLHVDSSTSHVAFKFTMFTKFTPVSICFRYPLSFQWKRNLSLVVLAQVTAVAEAFPLELASLIDPRNHIKITGRSSENVEHTCPDQIKLLVDGK